MWASSANAFRYLPRFYTSGSRTLIRNRPDMEDASAPDELNADYLKKQ
jgi:protein tyrosine phosphatase (PTP) superfamily phosphohydrolase (DUF442 family)